jgi:hypothetical protein
MKPVVKDPNEWLSKLGQDGFGLAPSELTKARSWSEVGTQLVPAVFSMVFFIAILFVLAMIVRAGFLFVLAQGEKSGLEKARIALVNAFIGIGLVFGVLVVFNLVQLLLGVNLTGNIFFGVNTALTPRQQIR